MKATMTAAVALALGAVQFGRAAEPRGALLFEDTFDGTAVDETKWGYETGFVRNDEPQWSQPANASVSNGILTIEARRERTGEARYTSASLCTLGKFSFTYGHVEMRAKLPDGKSVWPAFWMLGTNKVSKGTGWPKCGEIDIMEYWGHTPMDTTSCVHYWSPDVKGHGHAFRGPFRLRAEGLSEGFHVYSLDWTKDGLAFGFDGKTYAEVPLSAFDLPDGSNAFRRPHYLLMNLALTRKWGGKDDFPSVDKFPKRYEIDYVRVYAPATAVTGSPNTPLLFDLRCERLPEPLGVVEPRFSWKYANVVAPCFAFAVSSSPDAASAGDIFRCETQSHYLFDPKLALKPLTRYWWEVACGGATNQATFVTGACHPPETFFGFPTDDGGYWWAQRLVSVRKVRSAILAVTVRGSYRLFVNGHVLDDGIAPNRSRIETGFLLTETYDVTPFMTDGDNRIELLLDDGWGRVCGKRACFSVCGKFVTDAGEVLLGEDGPWRVAASEMHATGKGPPQDYFAGEYLKDLSRRTDALDWSPARPVTGEVFRVENDLAERDGEIGRLRPVSIGTKAPWKIDFGRNFCGFIRLRLKGRPGGLATVTVADKDGEECSFNQLWKFELDAEEGAFESRLNWMSGRYLYLSGAARPDVADVEGVALSSIRRQTGGFSGDRDLEDVAALDAATYRACTLRGVTMDCPHRERLGYGEAGISTTWGVGLPYFDTAAFYTAYLHKWASSQREDGYVPHVTPDYHGGGGTTWGNYPVVALADMLRKYPDPRLRDRMKRTVVGWLEFLRQQMKDGLLTRYEPDEWGFLGDWATPEGDDWGKSREAIYFNNAAYAYAIIRALEIDGLFMSEERELWIRHHRQLCSAIDRAFYADGVYVSTNARYQAVGLLCGAADGHRAETERMMLDIVRRKGYVDGGSAGFTMVLRALCDSYEGRELALRALRRRECPGYLYFRDQGDTTLPELWDRRDQYGGSRIHTCYTGASGFLLRGLAGFDIRGDRVSVTPHLSESLPRYSAFEETVNGRLSLNVERQGEKIRVSVDLPWGCEGTLNACGVHELHSGRNEQLLPMEQVC